MKTLPEIIVERATPTRCTYGTRRATRAEVFGRHKGRSRRIPSMEILGRRWEDGVKTEVYRRGKKYVVETIGEDFRAKSAFGSEREALDHFYQD